MKTPPIPAAWPLFPFNGVPLFDPIAGPKAAAEECLKDGGDVGPRLGVGPGGKIANLVITKGEVFEDKTTVEYVFVDGQKFVPEKEVRP